MVFEERAVPGIKQLIEDRGKLAERTKIASDAGAYEQDATTMTSGPAAAKRRQQLRSESFLKTKFSYDEELREELAQNALERGESAFRVDARKKQFDLYRGGGLSRDLSAAELQEVRGFLGSSAGVWYRESMARAFEGAVEQAGARFTAAAKP